MTFLPNIRVENWEANWRKAVSNFVVTKDATVMMTAVMASSSERPIVVALHPHEVRVEQVSL